jgi:DNA-binding XRE family transcriptional regulator
MRAELSQLRSEHTAQQQQLSRAVDARETVLSLLDAFKSNIKVSH